MSRAERPRAAVGAGAQDGAEFDGLPGLPPATAPADLALPTRPRTEADETATTLRGLNVTGVLGPVVDVGFESGSALGARVYSDDPDEVAGVRGRRGPRLPRRAPVQRGKHFPGLGAADQPTRSARPAWAST